MRISDWSSDVCSSDLTSMNKAFVKESDRDDDDDLPEAQALPAGTRNYMTPAGSARLRDELAQLMNVERPAVVQVVSWAAPHGDRSENGEYLYGRSEERRGGEEGGSTCRSRWGPV